VNTVNLCRADLSILKVIGCRRDAPFVFTTVVPRAASRDQHAAVNYASNPRLELEPAELNVWPFATDRIRTIGVNEPHFFIDRPRDGALYWKSHHHYFFRPAANL
jgi:hypothetical protein